jgi:hypothetical protein
MWDTQIMKHFNFTNTSRLEHPMGPASVSEKTRPLCEQREERLWATQ